MHHFAEPVLAKRTLGKYIVQFVNKMQPVKKTRSELLGNWTFESKFMKRERVNSLLVNCSQEILAANIHKFALQVRLMKGEFVLDIETTNSKCSFAEEQYSLSRVYPVEISRVLRHVEFGRCKE